MVDRHQRLNQMVLNVRSKAQASTTPTIFTTTATEFKFMDLAGTYTVQAKHAASRRERHTDRCMCESASMYMCVHVVAPDNDPDWVSRDYPVTKNDTDIDVQPFELSSVRAVIPSLPSSLTTSSSANTPSAIVTRHITLRLTCAKGGKTTWQIPTDTKSHKRKGTPATTQQAGVRVACHLCML